jgi:hypothetical protein
MNRMEQGVTTNPQGQTIYVPWSEKDHTINTTLKQKIYLTKYLKSWKKTCFIKCARTFHYFWNYWDHFHHKKKIILQNKKM